MLPGSVVGGKIRVLGIRPRSQCFACKFYLRVCDVHDLLVIYRTFPDNKRLETTLPEDLESIGSLSDLAASSLSRGSSLDQGGKSGSFAMRGFLFATFHSYWC